MTTTEIPFSQLVQHPRATVAKLEASPRRRLRLERRDGGDLILQAAERAEADAAAVIVTTRLFAALMSNTEGSHVLLAAFPAVFPWVRFLPPEDVREFVNEFTGTAQACAELGSMAPLEPPRPAPNWAVWLPLNPSLTRGAPLPRSTWILSCTRRSARRSTARTTARSRKPLRVERQSEGTGRAPRGRGRMGRPVRRDRRRERLGRTLPAGRRQHPGRIRADAFPAQAARGQPAQAAPRQSRYWEAGQSGA